MSDFPSSLSSIIPKISVVTLGCKVNQYDTDAMQSVFANAGFDVVEGFEKADVYLINTCAVTVEAERKSRQAVGKVSKLNNQAKIYVCGCASQNNFSQFAKDNIVYISGTDGKISLAKNIVEYLQSKMAGDRTTLFEKIVSNDFSISSNYEENNGVMSLRTRHYIKVQDGCNNFCSYCIVPYLRGRSRSRSLFSIITELDKIKNTAKEVVITGINLSAYGRDINIDTSLTDLLIALQSYSFRFRLGSLEVNIITKELLEATKSLKNFCPHFHLSLQSGDDDVLQKMNRKYTTTEFSKAVELIREYYPNAGITTDIIVGFPTETDDMFQNTLDFASKIEFSDIHIFPYSSRKGTSAGKLKILNKEIVTDRLRKMSTLKKELSQKFLMLNLSYPQEVLFETEENDIWCGHTRNYIKVYSKNGAKNLIEEVNVTELYDDGLKV